MRDLINATEMYLRAIYELEEEGVPPLRARICERLGQTAATVSETIARMMRAGLVRDGAYRRLELTPAGLAQAIAVTRKLRLAECLLADVIGLELEHVPAEACRWEHVMSEAVERKLLRLLKYPTASPFGDPIPGLRQLQYPTRHFVSEDPVFELDLWRLDEFAVHGGGPIEVRRICEHVQADPVVMAQLNAAGIAAGKAALVHPIPRLGAAVPVYANCASTRVPALVAHAVLVRPR